MRRGSSHYQHRPWRLAGLGLALSLLLVACGGDNNVSSAGGTSTTQPAEPGTTSPSADAAFPVTIDHKYGSTEIPEPPERIVTVGFDDQDAVLALGATPVGIREWFGDQPYATWPWATDELGNAEPAVLGSAELDFEQIASLRPDLILGLNSGLTDQEHATLSQIAPTVAQPGDHVDYGVPWQEQTLTIGRALGKEGQADELVADVEAQFEAARDAHPEFAGMTAVVASSGDGGVYFLSGPEHERARFLTSLGFEIPPAVADLAGDSFSAQISGEQLNLVHADVLIWNGHTADEFENNEIYQQLGVARESRALFLEPDGELYGALSFSSVLSLPFALDQLVPRLAAAVDGDPATEPTPTA